VVQIRNESISIGFSCLNFDNAQVEEFKAVLVGKIHVKLKPESVAVEVTDFNVTVNGLINIFGKVNQEINVDDCLTLLKEVEEKYKCTFNTIAQKTTNHYHIGA
jgi:hypothetical protein